MAEFGAHLPRCSSAPGSCGEGLGLKGLISAQTVLSQCASACPSPDELQNCVPMKSQSMHYSGRRSRRGRRRHSGRAAAPTPPKAKLTFWQRIVAFFKGSTTASQPEPEKPVQSSTTKERVSRKPELVEVTSPKLY